MLNWKFRSYGGQCRDGSKNGAKEVAEAMRDARFVWHTKNHGDGYGHVVHNAPAVGRPLIVKRDYYKGKLAEPLLVDGETCIIIDNLDPAQIVAKILEYEEKEKYQKLCKGAHEAFKKVVDFDKEATQIKEFVNRLQ